MSGLIIMGQRKQHIHIRGVFLLQLLIHLVGLFCLTRVKIQVTYPSLIAEVIGIFVGQFAHLGKSFLLVVHLDVDPVLLRGDLFVLTFQEFNAVEGLNHFLIVGLALIEFLQHEEDVAVLRI